MLPNCELSFFSSSGVSAMRVSCATYLMLKSDEAMWTSLNSKPKVQSPKWKNFATFRASPRLLFFVKLPLDERFQIGDGLGGISAANMQRHFTAGAGGEHHQAHDAFAVNFFPILFHKNITLKLVGGFDEKRRRPGMDAQLIGNGEFFGQKLTTG